MLFELATWHALAKLRLHTESTLRDLEGSTSRLGSILRKFQSTICNKFVTKELPSEEAARGRRTAALALKKASKLQTHKGKGKAKAVVATPGPGPTRMRKYNLSTYKMHALPDYPRYIRLFGSADGFSTWMVSSVIFL